MLGSEELGAEVGGGGWSCSACPGGTEESGEPWGMDFEWEGWAGRWEVLEKDTDQTELGAAEMWEEPWSRALSRRIEELGRVKGTPGEAGQVLLRGKSHLEPRWEFGGWTGGEEKGHRGTSLGFMFCYLELLSCVDPAMGPRKWLCCWGWSGDEVFVSLRGLGEGTRVTLGIWQDKGAAKS